MSASKRIGRWFVWAALGLGACSEPGGEGAGLDASGPRQQDASAGSDGASSPADDAGAPANDGGELVGDAGDEAGVGPSVRACLEAAQGKDSRTEALELVAKDGTQVAIVRYADPDAFGTSGTTVWLAERFGYARGADSACITETSKLSYQISHHNFADEMTAEHSGLALSFEQTRVDYDKPMFWSVEARQGTAALWGPLDLSLVACHDLTTDEDCTGRYQ